MTYSEGNFGKADDGVLHEVDHEVVNFVDEPIDEGNVTRDICCDFSGFSHVEESEFGTRSRRARLKIKPYIVAIRMNGA
jgi:hypothetical protein